MPRLLPLLAALCAAALLAAGCTSDKPGPNYSSVTPTPNTSTSSTPTESLSPTGVPTTGPNVNPGEVAPTEPTAALTNTQEGAQAFVAYYIKTLDWVYATSRPDLLSPFYEPTCSTCTDGQDFIEQLVKLGSIRGGRVTIRQIGLVTNDGRGGAGFAVSVNLSVGSATVVTAAGATATAFPPAPATTLTEWVKWDGTTWVIVEERYA